ncbi:MAG TPA: protein kinase [Rubrobacteraceae bacterium]|nr:protein kinase [Rubrobacteraceae bacterium]
MRLTERFVLEREIGSGGMSTVFLGRDEVLDRPIAVKLLKPGYNETDIGTRFRREGRTAARLSHPNIVQVYDAGEGTYEGRETSYIVMEYVPGGDLKDLMDRKGALSGAELARLSEAAAGLAHAHERGVIHRDIKPHNILLDENGRPKLSDFGVARALDASQATRTGAYLGTALYSPPEQLRGEGVTPKSDVYSLGVTLYHAATGEPPFTGAPIEIASQHVSKEPTPPREINDAVSPSMEALILDCMNKDPDARPTADEVRLRLLEAGRGVYATQAYEDPPTNEETTQEKPAGAVAPPRQGGTAPSRPAVTDRRRAPSRRGGILVALAVVAVLAVIGALAIPSLLGGGDEQAGGGNPSNNANQDPSGGGQDGQNQQEGGAGQQETSQAGSAQDSPSQGSQEQAGGVDQGQAEGGLTAEAAEQTVKEFYTSAARGDYDTSYALLTDGWRQEYFPTQADLAATFEPVQDVTFVDGPAAEVDGDTATVTGRTRAELDTQIEQNEGTWILVSENGEWRIDEWTVNRLSTQPT